MSHICANQSCTTTLSSDTPNAKEEVVMTKISRQSSRLHARRDCLGPTNVMEVRLNAAALSNPSSLKPLISLASFPHITAFSALIDCGSSHCFVETKFVREHNLVTYSVPPISLRLFDRSRI